jgi:hypothetical protein
LLGIVNLTWEGLGFADAYPMFDTARPAGSSGGVPPDHPPRFC